MSQKMREGVSRLGSLAATCAALVSVLSTACVAPPAEPADVVRTDSAGVRIVSSGAVDRELPWRFDSVDVLRDTLGVPWIFTGVSRGTVLIDRAGRTYVITRDPSVVRFGLDGRFDRTIGRKGGGPGEFEFPISISAQGDTLVVRDIARGVLVRFSSSLDPVADRRLDGAFASVGSIEFRSGGFWYSRQFNSDTLQGIELRADTVGGPPLQRLLATPGKPVRYSCVGLPFATPIFEPTINWVASGPRILVNVQPSYDLWLYEGVRVVARIQRPLRTRKPTLDDVRAQYPEGLIISFVGARPDCKVPAEEIAAKQGLAPQLPLVEDVRLFSDGTIWALRSLRSAETVVFDVFGSDGAYVGTSSGAEMPVGRYPNGDLLVPRDDAESGGVLLMRVKIRR